MATPSSASFSRCAAENSRLSASRSSSSASRSVIVGRVDRLGARGEGALFDHAVLDHVERRVGHARQIDERDFVRLGGVAGESGVGVRPSLHIAPALAEAGVDALLNLSPFVVVDDLGADRDPLCVVVEGDVGQLAGGDRPCMARTAPSDLPPLAAAASADHFSK